MQEAKSIIGKRCIRFDEIDQLVKFIAEQFNPEKIILFSTYAYGKPTAESDVDLLALMNLCLPHAPELELHKELLSFLNPYLLAVIVPFQHATKDLKGEFV